MRIETFFEKFELLADTPNAVATMRQLILQLALQGRLVDSNKTDEPIDKFLQRIWADKTRNRSELTRAEKPQPFELPAHWRWVALAEIVEFSIGKTPPRGDSSYWYPEDHSWVSIADMRHYGTITETKEKVSFLAAQDVFRHRFAEPGSILMSFKLTIGKVARARIRCFHNEAIISLKPPELELSEYLFRFLPIFSALQTSNNAIKGNTLNKGLLTSLPIALPPLAEQKRIVAKVDELMALCDRLEAQQAERETRHGHLARASLARFAAAPTPNNLDYLFHKSYDISPADLRKTILTLAVQGKLVPQDPNDEPAASLISQIAEEKRRLVAARVIRDKDEAAPITDDELPFDAPHGWEWTRLSSITRRIHYGYTASAKSELRDVRLLRITDIQNNLVDWPSVPGCEIPKDDVAQYHLERGDILVARTGGTVGKTYLVQEVPVVAVFASYLIRIQGGSALFDRYLKLFLESPTYWVQLEEGARGAAQPNVNGQTLGRMVVSLPPLAEQRRIVAKVDQLMALVDQLETQLAASRSAAEKLMEALVAELTAVESSHSDPVAHVENCLSADVSSSLQTVE